MDSKKTAHTSGRSALRRAPAALIAAALLIAAAGPPIPSPNRPKPPVVGKISLPPPRKKSDVSLEEALAKRRSVRRFLPRSLTLAEIGQLLWAGQGITDPLKGFRTAPSAGATYPLDLYVVAPDGLFHYIPDGHLIERRGFDDLRSRLAAAALDQDCVREAAIDIVMTAVFERTSKKYGERARRYVQLEAGHAAQNILLEATALDLGAVGVGAFYDERVKRLLDLPEDHEPLYIIAVGYPR